MNSVQITSLISSSQKTMQEKNALLEKRRQRLSSKFAGRTNQSQERYNLFRLYDDISLFLIDKDIQTMSNIQTFDKSNQVTMTQVKDYAKEFIKQISPELYQVFTWLSCKDRIKFGKSSNFHHKDGEVEIRNYVGIYEAVADLIHELTHAKKRLDNRAPFGMTGELASRVAECRLDRIYKENNISATDFCRNLLNDINLYLIDVTALQNIIICNKQAPATDKRVLDRYNYFFGSIGSIPIEQEVENKNLSFDDVLALTDENTADILSLFNINKSKIKTGVESFLNKNQSRIMQAKK